MLKHDLAAIALMLGIVAGCTETVRIKESRGRPTQYEDPGSPGRVRGVGLESQDVVSMTDAMARDILANPKVVGVGKAPARVVIDAEYLKNESSSVNNKNILTERLRTDLNRAADGRLVFLARHHAEMVEQESDLEKQEVVTPGTKGPTQQPRGWDYRLGGKIMSLDSTNRATGEKAKYHLIIFELIERGTGIIVWSQKYEILKSAIDDVVYQ